MDNVKGSPVVALANHQSEWETFFLYKILSPVCPILKKELLNIPFWGWALRLYHPIAIDRSRRHKAGRSILTQGVGRIKEGMSVVIFPEGTRTAVGRHKPFSRGGAKLAVAANTPILPVAHNAGGCWPPHRFLKHPGTIKLVIGPEVSVLSGDASALTDEVERWVLARLAEWN
ncbi:MAG: lysophospholipid acyltransferase family protein [Pseudohongiellaceae bacterium]